ncbi:MAG: hypothetical protein J6T70_10950 [Bacteroidales bacterium]|nr:hypothetical protein [Bacteroidales bacterium]
MNEYYQKTLDFQAKLQQYAWCIFKTYGRELVLRLEEYNLLQNKHNCIESSTAIGFVLEEFLVSKLEMYTHCSENEYVIDRFVGATASESFDCFSLKDGMKFMVNVKAEKNGQPNNALAAIGQLHRNYCLDNPEQEKCFILFKVQYSIQDAHEDSAFHRAKPRCIYIDGLYSYCLEEVDLSKEHKQDNRSWSVASNGKSNKNNGRLQISNAFRASHKVPTEEISYQNTYRMLTDLVNKNNQ